MAHLTLHKGDRLLMCSDGLHDYFPKEQELYDVVLADEPDDALQKLIDAAKERGGHDNITGVIIEVLEAPAVEETDQAMMPIVRATSDGIPHAIGKEDTLPVDAIAHTPPQTAADDAMAKVKKASADGHADTADGADPVAELDTGHEQDFRATMPIRVTGKPKKRARSKTQDGLGDSRNFSGEPTVELQPEDTSDAGESEASPKSSSKSARKADS
jgi:uncharacterized protein YbjQ (UPF0145 family)